MIFCTHGHLYHENHLPPMMSGDCLLYGHTHIPRAELCGDKWMLNPGSVSLPKEGNPPSYAVLEDGVFTIRRLDGTELMRAEIV